MWCWAKTSFPGFKWCQSISHRLHTISSFSDECIFGMRRAKVETAGGFSDVAAMTWCTSFIFEGSGYCFLTVALIGSTACEASCGNSAWALLSLRFLVQMLLIQQQGVETTAFYAERMLSANGAQFTETAIANSVPPAVAHVVILFQCLFCLTSGWKLFVWESTRHDCRMLTYNGMLLSWLMYIWALH